MRHPIVDAYEDSAGVERGYIGDIETLEQGGGWNGWNEYRSGWDAAIRCAIAEADRLCYAKDFGGNEYFRPSRADVVSAALRKLISTHAQDTTAAAPPDQDRQPQS